jgi:hypothetical protein
LKDFRGNGRKGAEAQRFRKGILQIIYRKASLRQFKNSALSLRLRAFAAIKCR